MIFHAFHSIPKKSPSCQSRFLSQSMCGPTFRRNPAGREDRSGERAAGTEQWVPRGAGRSENGTRASRPRRASLRQELFDFSGEILAGVHVAEVPLLVHQPHRRDAADAVVAAERVVPAFAIEILRPFHFLFGHKILQGLLFVVKTDAHDFEAFGMKFLVSGFYVWQLGDTGRAP